MTESFMVLLIVALSIGVGVLFVLLLRRKGDDAPMRIQSQTVAERVRSVGKLIGLEVHAKEIATSTKGWSWMPPLLLSQAKIAMIFHFEKQYFIELGHLRAEDVDETSPGVFTVRLPAIGGTLRLTDVTPYDIQAGRVLGLIDVIQMNASTQHQLMQGAQEQAADLFTRTEAKYVSEARRSIERHLESLLGLFDVEIKVQWDDSLESVRSDVAIESGFEHRLHEMASSA